jgi:hypothetical protein
MLFLYILDLTKFLLQIITHSLAALDFYILIIFGFPEFFYELAFIEVLILYLELDFLISVSFINEVVLHIPVHLIHTIFATDYFLQVIHSFLSMT